MSTQAERLVALEERLTAHETRCEERLAEIRSVATSTLKAVEGLRSRAWGISAALLAWALAQLWSANTDRIGRLEGPRPAVATPAAAGSAGRAADDHVAL